MSQCKSSFTPDPTRNGMVHRGAVWRRAAPQCNAMQTENSSVKRRRRHRILPCRIRCKRTL